MSVPVRKGSVSQMAVAIVCDLRFQRDIERFYKLGPRALGELLVEIGEQRLCRTYIENRVRSYGSISPEYLSALGGDAFPRPPLYGVQS